MASVGPLTWVGNDFLDAVRSDTIWSHVKRRVATTVGTVSFETLKALAVSEATRMLMPWQGSSAANKFSKPPIRVAFLMPRQARGVGIPADREKERNKPMEGKTEQPQTGHPDETVEEGTAQAAETHDGTEQSGVKPPWEREGEQLDPGRAWNLIQNLRADNAGLRETSESTAAKLRQIEDSKLTERERLERDLKETQAKLADIERAKAWSDARQIAAAARGRCRHHHRRHS